MKIPAPLENLLAPYSLAGIILAFVLLAEFAGGGLFFLESGLIHGMTIVFVGLIIIRILSDYASSDPVLKIFLRVQLAASVLLGLTHVYEYLGLYVLGLRSFIVELSVIAIYFVWFLCLLLSLELVSRAYYGGGRNIIVWVLSTIIVGALVAVIGINVSDTVASYTPLLMAQILLSFMVALAIMEVSSLESLQEVLPVFKSFSSYVIPATILLFFSAFFEYIESADILSLFNIQNTQITYFSHFLIYAVLALLLIGIGKLKNSRV